MDVTIKNLTEAEFFELFFLISGFAYHEFESPLITGAKKTERAFAEASSWETLSKVQKAKEIALQTQNENPELVKKAQNRFAQLFEIMQDKIETHNNLNPNNKLELPQGE